MIVDEVGHRCDGETCRVSARVRSEAWAQECFELWFQFPAEVLADHEREPRDCSPFLAALLPWCMRRSERLEIAGAASPRLLSNIPLAMDVYRAFWPDLLAPIEVVAGSRLPGTPSEVAASFFTRGVDSWFSVLTDGDRPYDGDALTHLVYVPTVDFMYDDEFRARAIEATRAAARSAGKVPLVAETNLRHHTETFLHWGYYHGAALAGIGLALGARRVLVPGARSYGLLQPEGAHPLLDHLWSTERTKIVHHGAEATRWDKVRRLTREPEALASLKVCFDANTDGNCGQCPKCLVTMVLLRAAGVTDLSRFDCPLDLGLVQRVDLERPLVELLRDHVLPSISERRLELALRVAFLRLSVRSTTAAVRAAARSALRSWRRAGP